MAKQVQSTILHRFCSEGERPTDKAIVPAEVEEDPVPPAFTSEPSTLDQLQEAYLVENKVPGRSPGTVLMLTSAQRRDGSKVEMHSTQSFKLWMVSWSNEQSHAGVLQTN